MSYLWKQDMIENVGLMPIVIFSKLPLSFHSCETKEIRVERIFSLSCHKERKNPPFVEVLHPTASLPSSNRSTFLLLFSDIPTIQWIRSQRLEFDFFVALHHSRSYFLLNRIFLGLNLFWESKFECQVPIVFQSCAIFTGKLKKKKPGQFQTRDLWKPRLISTTRVTTIAKDCCFFMRHSYEFSGILKINSKRNFYLTPDSS